MARKKITDVSEGRIYQLLERRKICTNAKFDVFFDTVEDFDGEVTKDFLIVRPRTQTADMVAGVCILPELDGKIGLMKGYRHQLGREVWQAPAGFVEENEAPVETALRELKEETTLISAPDRVVPLGMYCPDPGLIEGRVALFYAECAASSRSTGRVSGEVGTGGLYFFSKKELRELIASSDDLGGSTTVACFRYLEKVRE